MNETKMIESELELLKQIESLRAEVQALRQQRRTLADDGDAETVSKAQQAYDEAKATVKATEDGIAAQKAALTDLTTRQQAGDRSVSSTNVREVKDEIETLTNYLGHDRKVLQQTERALQPLVADQYLAHLAADSLETVTDVPVIIRRKPENAPDISPAIILSQTTPTEDYGTLEAAGSVRVIEVGETGVNWKAVKVALEDTGSEVSVTNSRITFDRACWPTPLLAKPSVHAVAEWMTTFENAWRSQVSGAGDVARLRERGFNSRITTTWEGLFRTKSTDLKAGDGKAVGTATFHVAAQHGTGECLLLDVLRDELTSLVNIFREETVGGITEAGRIVNVSLGDVKPSSDEVWRKGEVEHKMGSPVWPYTAQATVELAFEYESAEV